MASGPTVVRVVVDGWTWCKCQEDNISDARQMLLDAFEIEKWPSQATFAVTPGGFVRIPFQFGDIEGGWRSERYFDRLKEPAAKAVGSLLTNEVKALLKGRVRYLTVGIDLNNTDKKASPETHAELVAVVDAESGEITHWTGKSYPTNGDQARTLVQAPLESHCFRRGKERVLILDVTTCTCLAAAADRLDMARRERSKDGKRCSNWPSSYGLKSSFITRTLLTPHAFGVPHGGTFAPYCPQSPFALQGYRFAG